LKKILITGVAGLLGSRMAEWILQNHAEVKIIGIDDLSGGYIEHVPNGVEFHQLDITSDEIADLFKGVSIVYHFAAYAAEGLSPFIRKFNYRSNIVGTASVVNACIEGQVGRLVFTSSMAVYGVGNPPFKESDLPEPIDPYGVAKYACEMDIKIAGSQHGLDWCILRPHNVYGRNQNIWDRYRNVLGIWMFQNMNELPFTIFGDGRQQRAFSCIDDCLLPLWKAGVDARASKKIINIGSWRYYSIQEAAQILKEVIGKATIRYEAARHEVKDALPAHELSISILDYQDNTTLRMGLKMMWDWAQKQPRRSQKSWDKYELEKGIYQFWKNP
jgi:UDP-glucose 4-epimerase